MTPHIAVLIPCFNEEMTVAKVIRDFKKQLPDADLYVFDNNSTDNTVQEAVSEGATVFPVPMQGKGHAVCSMFRLIDADVYVMVDGDDTYPADEVNHLLKPIVENKCDMVSGDRHSNGSYTHENKRAFHVLGNALVPWLIGVLFGVTLKDAMTGYRVFNRRFVKNVPILSRGFEVEVELTMTALHYNYRVVEVPVTYRDRPEGSFSKLNTFRDGFRILSTILGVFRKYKPLTFFSAISFFFIAGSLGMGIPIVFDFLKTGTVQKFPTAFLSLGLGIIATLMVALGLILNSISRMNRELMDVFVKQSH